MYKMLFKWAFNDSLLLRLFASSVPASSSTKVAALRSGFQLIYACFDYGKTGIFLLKPLPAGRFSRFF
jgi:hypothetical protein